MKENQIKIWSIIEKMVYVILTFVLRMTGRKLTDTTFEGVMEFIKFGIVGLSNTVISYVIYAVCLLTFQKLQILEGIDFIVAQVIQFLLSVLWSFYWNNKVVFTLRHGEQRSLWKALLKTYISYSFTGLFLNSILLVLWIKVLHVSEFIAPIINLVVSVPLNFLINKFWAFKKD